MNIYDRIIELKQMRNCYEMWEEYRENLTSYIIKHVSAGDEIAVFGAGRCGDIDLKLLSDAGACISLFDNDYDAMSEAVEHYGIDAECILCDFVGIFPDEYREIQDIVVRELRRHNSIEKAACEVYKYLQEVYAALSGKTPAFGERCFDMAICAGVCSQINNTAAWIWEAVCNTFQYTDDEIFNLIKENNSKCVEKFHGAIINSVRGKFIAVNELERYGVQGSVEGAWQAINDIKKSDKIKVIDEKMCDWIYNNNIKYRMLIQYAEKCGR